MKPLIVGNAHLCVDAHVVHADSALLSLQFCQGRREPNMASIPYCNNVGRNINAGVDVAIWLNSGVYFKSNPGSPFNLRCIFRMFRNPGVLSSVGLLRLAKCCRLHGNGFRFQDFPARNTCHGRCA